MGSGNDGLTPIRDVADHFGLPLSTLHYWERRELIAPTRRAGQRWYDTEQLYRVALIKQWRTTGLIGVEHIAEMLTDGPDWREAVPELIAECERRRAELDEALDYLNRLRGCRYEGGPERCPGFRALVSLPGQDAPPGGGAVGDPVDGQEPRGIRSGAAAAATARQPADTANAAV
ncbi:MerR family transcriptional regulator [Streptomyces sp. NPDC059474]|uniref:helix-turn-helix domain-containing protein n=1 Tax=unclassified Streptomyces TaxID=2593676 RepID=UPI0033C4DEB8